MNPSTDIFSIAKPLLRIAIFIAKSLLFLLLFNL